MKKVAVLGPKGTFSDLASQKYLNGTEYETIYFPSIDATVEGLKHADLAVVPIENTLDGYVQQTLDLILEHKFYVVDEIYVPVQFSLIAQVLKLSEIKRVYTQFVTKGQCQQFLKKIPYEKLIITDSNMESYQMVLHGHQGDAAIVPFHMVDTYNGFKIQNVTDSSENFTRFFILAKKEGTKIEKEMKVSIVVVPINDRPGLLFDILGIFKKYDINLVSIMSRPTKKSMGNYNFFIEMKAKLNDQEKINQALLEIKKDFFIQILGIYPTSK
ncbi:MAG: ACT domain-containing protein [Firmicutes bacterium]|nr:ACT domain-containing protein [Bacillota bacterium]